MAIAIRSTAIGAFATRPEAEQAVSSLLGAGFGPGQIGIVLPETAPEVAGPTTVGPIALWAGAVFRKLIGAQIPDVEVGYYEEALQEGRPLVMVRSGDRFPEAMDILYRCGGEYMAAF